MEWRFGWVERLVQLSRYVCDEDLTPNQIRERVVSERRFKEVRAMEEVHQMPDSKIQKMVFMSLYEVVRTYRVSADAAIYLRDAARKQVIDKWQRDGATMVG